MTAVPLIRSDVKTLRLAHPVVRRSSRVELTAFGVLTVAATGIWLFVLPLELLAFLA